MAEIQACSWCAQLITSHGTQYRHINCAICESGAWDVCFDCYRKGNRCHDEAHELRLGVYDYMRREHAWERFDNNPDVDALEAGCTQGPDPDLWVNMKLLPSNWFETLRFAGSKMPDKGPLRCTVFPEPYEQASEGHDLAILIIPTNFPLGTKTYSIIRNGKKIQVAEGLFEILKLLPTFPWRRFWVRDLCLSEELQQSPPFSFDAITGLACQITRHHINIFSVPAVYKPLSSSEDLRLVRFHSVDRFGSPRLISRTVSLDCKPIFHVRILPTAPRDADVGLVKTTVFVDGHARQEVSQEVVNFFRTCYCSDNTSERNDGSSACPRHDGVEYFIPDLCADSSSPPERAQFAATKARIQGQAASVKSVNAAAFHGMAYIPLAPDEIRLLRFFPARLGRKGIEVPMAVITCKRADAPPGWAALSYCWGSDERQQVMRMLTGEYLDITKALLPTLNHVGNADGISYLWIDQVCIDQTNLTEKAEQVRNMIDIYKGGPLSTLVSDGRHRAC